MKSCIALLGIVATGALGAGCAKHDASKETAPGAMASAEATGTAKAEVATGTAVDARLATVQPRIGGSISRIGEHAVEVVVHRAGLVEAVVTDSSGTELHADVKLGITVSSRAGARESIALAFSSPRARFIGQARAGVELGSAPVDVSLEIGGKKAEGRLELCVALERPRFGGHLLSLGAFSAEVLLQPNGTVHALLLDASGAEVHAGVELEASVRTAAGASERIVLSFDSALARFTGQAAASARLAPGPLSLSLKTGGKLLLGGLANATIHAALGANGSAKAGLSAGVDADAPRVAATATLKTGAGAGAKAQAAAKAAVAAPKVSIQTPKVDVSVKKTATAVAKPGASAKASAGFSFGTK
jgi:hypothetical protein